jgi:hypothetical protein
VIHFEKFQHQQEAPRDSDTLKSRDPKLIEWPRKKIKKKKP